MLQKFVNFQIPSSGVQSLWLYAKILETNVTVAGKEIVVGFFPMATDEYPIRTQTYFFDDKVTDAYSLLLTLEEFEGFEKV